MSAKKKGSFAVQTKELTDGVIADLGYDLVDVEYKKEGSDWYLRLFIDKRGGITIEDCEAVSRAIDPLLDDELDIPGHYMLEVSSPGLDRPLKTTKDLLRYLGKEVEVSLYQAIDGQRTITGYIQSADDEMLVLTAEEPLDANEEPLDVPVAYTLKRSQLAKVSQVIKF